MTNSKLNIFFDNTYTFLSSEDMRRKFTCKSDSCFYYIKNHTKSLKFFLIPLLICHKEHLTINNSFISIQYNLSTDLLHFKSFLTQKIQNRTFSTLYHNAQKDFRGGFNHLQEISRMTVTGAFHAVFSFLLFPSLPIYSADRSTTCQSSSNRMSSGS